MPSSFLDFSVQVALVFISATFLITVFKVIKGPTLPDRVLALDLLVGAAIGFIAVLGIKTGFTLYLDIAIALGLVGFLATVAFARFILARGQSEDSDDKDAEAPAEVSQNTSRAKMAASKPRAPRRKANTKRADSSKSNPKMVGAKPKAKS
jgi:multicomponent Na+:H+ antiporter subunit F